MSRNTVIFLATLVGLLALCYGIAMFGVAPLANTWFMAVAAAVAGATCAAAFSYEQHGRNNRVGTFVESIWRPALVSAIWPLMWYLPMSWEWLWTKFHVGPWGLVGVPFAATLIWMMIKKILPPAGPFWGFVIGIGAVTAHWGFTMVQALAENLMKYLPATFGWLVHGADLTVPGKLVITLLALLVGAVVAVAIMLPVSLCSALGNAGIIFWAQHPHTACLIAEGEDLGDIVVSGTGVPLPLPQNRTPQPIIDTALRNGNWEPVYQGQLWGWNALGQPNPQPNFANEADWATFWSDLEQREGVMGRLDPRAFGNPRLKVMPRMFYPGFPAWVDPFYVEHGMFACINRRESGEREVILPRHYVDIRKDAPRRIETRWLTVEPGFNIKILASFRYWPVWIPILSLAKEPRGTLIDGVENGLGQIGQLVGPWIFGFMGDPLADLARGDVQRGLVMLQNARPATPYTRRTSMLAQPLQLAPVLPGQPPAMQLPQLAAANRPEFPWVRAIWYATQIRILQATGIWVFDLQIDDVDVPEHIEAQLANGPLLTHAASHVGEAGVLQSAAMFGKVAGAAMALGSTNLSAAEQTEVLKSMAQFLGLAAGQSPVDLLVSAGAGHLFRGGNTSGRN